MDKKCGQKVDKCGQKAMASPIEALLGAKLTGQVWKEGGQVWIALTWRDAFLVLNLCLHVFDAIGWFYFERNSLAGEGLDKDLHVDECLGSVWEVWKCVGVVGVWLE